MSHGKHKPKSIIDTHTQKKRKKNPKITLKLVNKITREQKKKGTKNTYEPNPKTINKMAIRTYISIIISVTSLNTPIKRHRVVRKQ